MQVMLDAYAIFRNARGVACSTALSTGSTYDASLPYPKNVGSGKTLASAPLSPTSTSLTIPDREGSAMHEKLRTESSISPEKRS
jgi:hypothetical protein